MWDNRDYVIRGTVRNSQRWSMATAPSTLSAFFLAKRAVFFGMRPLQTHFRPLQAAELAAGMISYQYELPSLEQLMFHCH
jgi:hypothetical protein